MTSSPVPPGITAQRVFSSWSGMRTAIALRTLSSETVEAYRSIWNGWLSFLAKHGSEWDGAGSEDARAFLENLSPSSPSKTNVSAVTQKRYFRVLKEIYACAMANAWLGHNPFDLDAKVSRTEHMDSLVFNRNDWAVLFRSVPSPSEEIDPDTPWQSVRNRSMLLMMMQEGLGVSELRTLTLASVHTPRLTWESGQPILGLPFMPWEPQSSQRVRLLIQGERTHQHRTLTLSDPNEMMLLAWLQWRLQGRFPLLAESPLYVSRKRAGPLSAKSVFALANAHIRSSLSARYAVEELAHAGPMALRNSCIVRWLDAGMEDALVLERAGFKDLQALRRLRQHVVERGTTSQLTQ